MCIRLRVILSSLTLTLATTPLPWRPSALPHPHTNSRTPFLPLSHSPLMLLGSHDPFRALPPLSQTARRPHAAHGLRERGESAGGGLETQAASTGSGRRGGKECASTCTGEGESGGPPRQRRRRERERERDEGITRRRMHIYLQPTRSSLPCPSSLHNRAHPAYSHHAAKDSDSPGQGLGLTRPRTRITRPRTRTRPHS